MERNEPSTAEIVTELMKICAISPQWKPTLCAAFNRLEQLERDNAALKSRAEKAEEERDAAIRDRTRKTGVDPHPRPFGFAKTL